MYRVAATPGFHGLVGVDAMRQHFRLGLLGLGVDAFQLFARIDGGVNGSIIAATARPGSSITAARSVSRTSIASACAVSEPGIAAASTVAGTAFSGTAFGRATGLTSFAGLSRIAIALSNHNRFGFRFRLFRFGNDLFRFRVGLFDLSGHLFLVLQICLTSVFMLFAIGDHRGIIGMLLSNHALRRRTAFRRIRDNAQPCQRVIFMRVHKQHSVFPERMFWIKTELHRHTQLAGFPQGDKLLTS